MAAMQVIPRKPQAWNTCPFAAVVIHDHASGKKHGCIKHGCKRDDQSDVRDIQTQEMAKQRYEQNATGAHELKPERCSTTGTEYACVGPDNFFYVLKMRIAKLRLGSTL